MTNQRHSHWWGGLLERAAPCGPFLVFLAVVCIVFFPHLFGINTFIGESDRLNSYLNIRLAEFDAFRDYGRVPGWSDIMFGGFSLSSLHWMNPGQDPIGYFLRLFPRDQLFIVLGFVAAASILAACVSSYLYILDVTEKRFPAMVGGVAYGLSVFSLHRVAQSDDAHLTVVMLPLGLLALRRVNLHCLLKPFLSLMLIMTALVFWGFLQEVAYAFLFFGIYGLYRSCTLIGRDRSSALAVFGVLAAASVASLLFAAPRLLDVGLEYSSMARAGAMVTRNSSEFLRLFHEGIFGRYFEEGRSLGNNINLHEGLQLLSSSMLALFVYYGATAPKTYWELCGSIILFSIALTILFFVPAVVFHSFEADHSTYMVSVASVLLVGIPTALAGLRLAGIGANSSNLTQRCAGSSPGSERAFHLLALGILLILVLFREGLTLVYELFREADFTHSRLSILMVLPLCTLFSIYLVEMMGNSGSIRIGAAGRWGWLACGALIGCGSAYLIHGPLLDGIVALNGLRLRFWDDSVLAPTVLLKIALTVVFLGFALFVAISPRTSRLPERCAIVAVSIGCFVAAESTVYAQFKIDGPHTQSFPIPFRNFNYMNVARLVLRPPEPSALQVIDKQLDADRFQAVVIEPANWFPLAISPHASQFWHIRLLGGYGTGVSARLADLPWPSGIVTARTIEIESSKNFDFSLLSILAFLNVKYMLVLTPDVYFNTVLQHEPTARANLAGVLSQSERKSVEVGGISFDVVENPVRPLPREFLVGSVTGGMPALRQAFSFGRNETPASDADILFAFAGQTEDLVRHSFVEGIEGTREFDASGDLCLIYRGDVIDVRIERSLRERFLVINQTYNSAWHAYVGDTKISTLPTNHTMLGVTVPPNVERLQLRYEPPSSTLRMRLAPILATIGAVIFAIAFRRWEMRLRSASLWRRRTPC
jgi:hypothetical protein